MQSLAGGDFHRAGVGREQDHQVNDFIRADLIHWLSDDTAATRDYLDWMERLRLGLNRRLFLGLFDYECHYARYPRGGFYRKHLDAFRGGPRSRVLTTVLYLNPAWQSGDGGELALYDADSETLLERVEPQFGRLVIFLSEDFPHEVLPTQKARFSLTGWFRVNNSDAAAVDPPG